MRSLGSWPAVRALRRSGDRVLSDDRILDSGKFVQRVIKEAGAKSKKAGPRGPGFPDLIIPQKRLRP